MFHKPLGVSSASLFRASWDFKESGSLFGLNIPSGSYPMLSPNGLKLLYVKGDQSFQAGTEIFLIDTLGTNDSRLTTNNRDDRTPFWSPDGLRIVWSGDLRVTIMNADGSAQKDITYGRNPSWSVNDEIVFSNANSDYTKEVLYTISPDGNGKKQITI